MTVPLDRSRAFTLGVGTVALSVLIAGIVAISTSDDGPAGAAGPSASGKTITSPVPTTSTGGGLGGSSKRTPSRASAARPPAPGAYRYRFHTTVVSGGVTTQKDTALAIMLDAARAVPGGWQQTQRFTADGQTVTTLEEWRPDRVLVLRTDDGKGGVCTYSSPLLHYRWPMSVGERWSVGPGTCREGEEGAYYGIGGVSVVIGRETVRVGDASVQTFSVRTTAHRHTATADVDTVTTIWFSPVYRLVVKARQEIQSSSNSATLDQVLLSVKPGR